MIRTQDMDQLVKQIESHGGKVEIEWHNRIEKTDKRAYRRITVQGIPGIPSIPLSPLGAMACITPVINGERQ